MGWGVSRRRGILTTEIPHFPNDTIGLNRYSGSFFFYRYRWTIFMCVIAESHCHDHIFVIPFCDMDAIIGVPIHAHQYRTTIRFRRSFNARLPITNVFDGVDTTGTGWQSPLVFLIALFVSSIAVGVFGLHCCLSLTALGGCLHHPSSSALPLLRRPLFVSQ